jgi:hypothetical protein
MHLKEIVIDPSIAHGSIGNQRHGMSFVTVDAEEAFSTRDSTRRLLPVAQLQYAR